MAIPDTSLTTLAAATLSRCGLATNETLFLLFDDATVPALVEAFRAAGDDAAANVHLVSAGFRDRAFAELDDTILDRILAPGLVIDLTAIPWLYSDSLTRYATDAQTAGSRMGLIWGDRPGLETLSRSAPDFVLFEAAEAIQPVIVNARTFRLRSDLGTEFTAELTGDASFIGRAPINPGDITAPLYASLTAPFATGTASGRLVFTGAGRLQGPIPTPFFGDDRVEIQVVDGFVVGISGDGPIAELLREWRSAAPTAEVDRIMDFNLGFDPRGNLESADNMVVHCYGGGVMIGIGSPYEYDPAGSRKPGFHLDLLCTGCDLSVDATQILREGIFQ